MLYIFFFSILFINIYKLGVEFRAFKRTSFQNGELTIGIKIRPFEYESEKCKSNVTLNPVPRNLIMAWRGHMREYEVDDVEFDVRGKKFYTSSLILRYRSNYFRSMLSGEWSETSNARNNEKTEKSTSDNEDDVNMTKDEEGKYDIPINILGFKQFFNLY